MTSPPQPSPTPGSSGTPDSSGPLAPNDAHDVTRRARDLVAEVEGVAVERATVVSVDKVTWRDGALGCPQPGYAYTQALVPGYRVVVEVDGRHVHVHADDRRNGALFICDKPVAPLDVES